MLCRSARLASSRSQSALAERPSSAARSSSVGISGLPMKAFVRVPVACDMQCSRIRIQLTAYARIVMSGAAEFLKARDFLLSHRTDYEFACRHFQWPQLHQFNWALDYFDVMAAGNTKPALWVVDESGAEFRLSFAEMSQRSNRVAQFLRELGVRRGDCMLLMLGNEVALWETLLAASKLGAVVIPAATLLAPEDLEDRMDRGAVRHVIVGAAHTAKFAALAGVYTRICAGGPAAGWHSLEDAYRQSGTFAPDGVTRATDPLLLYFTSGTTAK